jgi:cysteine desulfurase/selenocysteine lyase
MPATILQNAFALDPELIYLNHAAVAPWPQAAADAVAAFAKQNASIGAEVYPTWNALEQRLRERLARLINAPSAEDIALVKNTSEALSVVACGLDWRAGDEVVGIAGDFPSNRLPWEAQADQGVRFVAVDVMAETDPESALIAACGSNTRLMAVSSVHYATGLRLDLERLGAFCRQRGIYLCVDAIQSLGAIPFDVAACQADFVAADGHKWLLGPEGLGLFYCRPEVRDRLRLHQFGWHMVEAVGDFDAPDWAPAQSARRFECGSPNMVAAHALEASVALIEQTGVEHIFTSLLNVNAYLTEKAQQIGLSRKHGYDLERRGSGIVTVDIGAADPTTVWRKLMAQRVVTAPRGGGIRFSPHLHNSHEQIDQALSALQQALM